MIKTETNVYIQDNFYLNQSCTQSCNYGYMTNTNHDIPTIIVFKFFVPESPFNKFLNDYFSIIETAEKAFIHQIKFNSKDD